MDFNAVLAGLPQNTWNSRCIAQLPIHEDANFTRGLIHLVDAEGRAMNNFTRDTWGVTIGDCYEYCGSDKVPYVSTSLF